MTARASAGAFEITLVHGTFAPDAAWTRDGSSLRRALAERLPNAAFHAFAWSGANAYADRAEAARSLALFLDQRVAAAPAAVHAVIAHSHGGNIALHAGKHTTRAESLANVACLATPFIAATPIKRGLFDGVLLWALCALVVAAVGATTGYFGSALLRQLGFSEAMSVLTLLPAILLWAALGPWWLFAFVKRRMAAGAKERLAELTWPVLPATRLLVVGYAFDEARTYLDYLNRGTSRLSRRLWRNAELHLVALLGLAFLIPFAVDWFGLAGLFASELFRRHEVELIIAIYALAAIALLLPLLRSHPYGYGWERLSNSWTLDITAAERPEGLVAGSIEEWSIPIGGFRKVELAHTVIYDDPRMHEKLAAWLAAAPMR